MLIVRMCVVCLPEPGEEGTRLCFRQRDRSLERMEVKRRIDVRAGGSREAERNILKVIGGLFVVRLLSCSITYLFYL